MKEENNRLKKILEEVSDYLAKAQNEEVHRDIYVQKITALLEKEGKKDSVSWFFLGTMYMPRINQPFPDDYEKAIACFEKVDRKAELYWANAMSNIGLYYHREKKEYLRAAAYFSLALQYDSKAKKVKNYFELSMAHVSKRNFWMEEFKKIQNQSQIERMIQNGNDRLELKCPKCKSKKIKNASAVNRLQKRLSLQNILGKSDKYMGYCCEECGHEW